jgi:hypothetical protein
MGRLDIAMKELMNDYNVFADAFNFRRAEGRKILPSSLREMDPSAYAADALAGVFDSQSSDLARQLVVRGDESRTCAMLLLENQFRSNRLMPFRYLYAAAMHWRRVVMETARLHKKANDLITSDDFLAGFGPDDFLPRLYMMVLYAGKEPWKGPLRLAELLDRTDADSGLYEPDCRLNIISLAELSEAEVGRFQTNEMKVMATAVRLQDDLKKLEEVSRTDPAFRSVDRELYNIVKISTGFDLPTPIQPKGNNMSTAIEEYKKSVKNEGRLEGRLEGAEERDIQIVTNMLKKKCSLAMIEDFIQISQKQIIQIAKANNIPLP